MPAFTLPGKCPHSEFFEFVFSSIRTQFGDFPCKFRYSVQTLKYTDQKNSEHGQFLFSDSNSISESVK